LEGFGEGYLLGKIFLKKEGFSQRKKGKNWPRKAFSNLDTLRKGSLI